MVEPGLGPTRTVYGCNRTLDMVCQNTLRAGGNKSAGQGMNNNGHVPAPSGPPGCVTQTPDH